MTARGERLDAARLYGRSSGTLSQMGRLYFADRLRSRTRTVANDQLIEARIRARAHRLWEEEGWPEGRAKRIGNRRGSSLLWMTPSTRCLNRSKRQKLSPLSSPEI